MKPIMIALISKWNWIYKTYEKLKPFFVEKALLHHSFTPDTPLVKEDTVIHDPWIPDRIDYLNDFR